MNNLKEIVKGKFKHFSNKRLIERINRRFKTGLNDDDEVFELFRRKAEQNLNIIVGFDYYAIKEGVK